MTGPEIHAERDDLCRVIKEATTRLHELSKLCDHGETFVGNYAFERPPNIHECTLCKFCMKVIENPFAYKPRTEQ